jgi:Flp pilus assembly pilin Flp
MFRSLLNLWQRDDGQDVIEYTLLIAFVVIVTAGVFGIGSDSIQGIVGTSTNQLRTGNDIAHGH